ncbi:unnamed protein product, partial [Ectocarpus sp. 8 AP-2014]
RNLRTPPPNGSKNTHRKPTQLSSVHRAPAKKHEDLQQPPFDYLLLWSYLQRGSLSVNVCISSTKNKGPQRAKRNKPPNTSKTNRQQKRPQQRTRAHGRDAPIQLS